MERKCPKCKKKDGQVIFDVNNTLNTTWKCRWNKFSESYDSISKRTWDRIVKIWEENFPERKDVIESLIN